VAGPGRRKRAENPHAEGAPHLADRLRHLRERARKTQEEVAAAAGLSVATVRKIETGAVTEPGYFTVLAIVRAIGASIADLAELACNASSRYDSGAWLQVEVTLIEPAP
jgi:transcriptional regulator with XRE-family HTH domain